MTELAPLVLLAPVLVLVAFFDLRDMRIPNTLSLTAMALFAICVPLFLPLDAALYRVVIAASVLVAGFAAFSLGLIGAGDVKFFSALLLFVPTHTMSVFLLLFSAATIFGIALMPVLRAIPDVGTRGWVSLQRDARFPMGIAIALAGLAHPLVVSALLRAV